MNEAAVVSLGRGVQTRVERRGEGPPIVLLHGFTGDASTMDGLASRLEAEHTVLVPDLIGHGGSTGPEAAHGVDEMAAQVVQMMDALGHPSPFDLVGYSLGGRVALTLGCRHPERVASLTVIGASAGLATDEERAERAAADDALAASILDEGLEAFVERWMANPLFATQARLGSDFLLRARAQRLRNAPEGLARSLRAAGTGRMRPLHTVLSHATFPVVLAVGADDPKFVAIARDLVALLPDAAVAIIDDAGHAAHLEQPDAVAAEIRRLLARGTVRIFDVAIPLTAAHTTARGTTTRRNSGLIGLRAGGHTGWGEAAPLDGWSVSESTTAADTRPDGPLAADGSAWDATSGWRTRLEDSPTARAAVAGAALDLDARRAGRPLHRHLASWHPLLDERSVLARVDVNALVSSPDPAAVQVAVARLVAAGFATVKLKVGAASPAEDLARVAAARGAAADVALRLDANGAWDHPTAVAFLRDVARHGVVLCEEPVRGVEAIAAVARECDVPLAVDESVRDATDVRRALAAAEHLGAMVVKPQAIGGADRAIERITAARSVGLEVIVTSLVDSAVGLAHAAHVAAACGLPSAHGLATAGLLESDVAPGLVVVDGRIEMPTSVGLGIGLVSPPTARPS